MASSIPTILDWWGKTFKPPHPQTLPHPPPRPLGTADAEKILALYKFYGWPIRTGAGRLNILYLEGRNKDLTPNANRPDAFDDLRLVWVCDFAGTPTVAGGPWWATTEPSQFWTDNPMPGPSGAFHIDPGYQSCWGRGEYHGQPALVQTTPIWGTRDPQRTDTRHPGQVYHGVFGVHHHGTPVRSRDHMGRSSAGCLVGYEGHSEFMRLVDEDPDEKANPGRFTWGAAVCPPDWWEKAGVK